MYDSLKHVGVLGMRWGHRKGKTTNPGSEDHQRISAFRKKKLKDMSNKEIQDVITRINLESQYKNLNPSTIGKGKRVISDTLSVLGKITAAAATLSASYSLGKKFYNMLMKTDIGS